MSFSVVADVGGPILFAGFGIVAYLALSLLESIVLRLLKWGTFWRSLLASLLMNLPSVRRSHQPRRANLWGRCSLYCISFPYM